MCMNICVCIYVYVNICIYIYIYAYIYIIHKRGGRALLTEMLSPRMARPGNRVSTFNERISSKSSD